MAEENQPKEVTIDEALSHVKDWVDSGDLDKAKKGLKEIMEFAPDNQGAKDLLESIKQKENTQPIDIKPAEPTEPANQVFSMPEEPKIATEQPVEIPVTPLAEPTPPVETEIPIPEPVETPNQMPTTESVGEELPGIEKLSEEEIHADIPTPKEPKSIKKFVIIAIAAVVIAGGAVGGYFLYQNYQASDIQEEEQSSEDINMEDNPELTEELLQNLFKEEESQSTEVVSEMEDFVEIFEENNESESSEPKVAVEPVEEKTPKVKVKPLVK